MTRDYLRFRVWDRTSKLYRPDIELRQNGEVNGIGNFNQDNFVVEQSTGCRDRHNQIIYEGDIYRESDGSLWFVKRKEAYGVAAHLQPFRLDEPDMSWNFEGGIPTYTGDPDYGVAIVGNIHTYGCGDDN